jgi:lipopolysaccharide transport system ATP-binding protein
MNNNILEVTNIGKAYRSYGSEWRRILTWFGVPFVPRSEHWTLQNVSFSLPPGEAVGIVGQNGAGKSTLLKAITGTLKPTTGNVTHFGRIAAILELGMGFHPDLTGRQNSYHSAGLMGYNQQQIDSVIADIEAFAEIGEYFDQPVRVYSSGMQVRVAFAIATAFRPEILIIDEALSVGDAYFQHKSFDKIRQFRELGTSLLFVSHDKSTVLALCDRAILLEQGKVIKDGDPESVMDFYNALLADKENNRIEQIVQENGRVQTISGTREAQVEDIGLYNIKGEKVELVSVGDPVELRIKVKINQDIPELILGYMIKDRLGQPMFGITSKDYDLEHLNLISQDAIEFIFRFNITFGVGSYSIATALALGKTHIEGNLEWRDLALVFNVINTNKKHFVGANWVNMEAYSQKVSDDKTKTN